MIEEAIVAWALTPGGRKLLTEARRRLESGSKLARGELRLALTKGERHDIGGLLGVEWEVSGRGVPVRALHKALESRGTTLRAVLEAESPLRDRRAERLAARAAAEAEMVTATGILQASGHSAEAIEWTLSRRGVPRPGGGLLTAFTETAALVWCKLPGDTGQPVLLAQLAGDVLDDTHALDRSTQLGRTVARLAAAQNIEPDQLGSIDVRDALQWRAAWASVGVACDEVSSLVLVLNLRLVGDAPAAHMTEIPGEPVWLSLRSLKGTCHPEITSLFVCENPSIVEAAADRIGAQCPPILCTFGQPSVAALHLLRACVNAGVKVRLRADDDGVGQAIVAKLRTVAPDSELWRYHPRPRHMAKASPVYEEQSLDALLEDLRVASLELAAERSLPVGNGWHVGRIDPRRTTDA